MFSHVQFFVPFFSAYSTWTVILMIICTSLILLCTTLFYCLSNRNQLFPGGPDGDGRRLFRQYREDAFLMQLQKYGNINLPSTSISSSTTFPLSTKSNGILKSYPCQRTLTIDTVTTTADPKVVRSILMSKVHSINRSWVYRLIANIMPSSDGILFSANEEWKIRHSLFTQLFMGNHIRNYTGEIIIAGIRTCEMVLRQQQLLLQISSSSDDHHQEKGTVILPKRINALSTDALIQQLEECGNIHEETYGNSKYLMEKVMNKPKNSSKAVIVEDKGIHCDLLTMVRWSAVRFLLKYGMNINMDIEEENSVCTVQEGKQLAYTLDAYSRICFEIMPTIERKSSPLVPWFQEYRNLFIIRNQLKTILSPIVHKVQTATENTVRTKEENSNDSSSTNGTGTLDNFFTRMINDHWKLDTIVSEINHLHGAHKAVALLTTCALVELTAHPTAREKVRAELIDICGEPPQTMSASERILYVQNLMKNTAQSWDEYTAQETIERGGNKFFWRPPSRTDIEKQRLPYCVSVLRETARKHVVSMGTMRKLGEPLQVSLSTNNTEGLNITEQKVTLPSSHEIMLLLHAMHHDPIAWGHDAHNWIPERWDRSSEYWAKKIQYQQQQQYPTNYSYNNNAATIDYSLLPPEYSFPSYIPDMYVPFLAGTRRCGGMLVAELEFLNYLFVYLVMYDVKAILPPITEETGKTSTNNNATNTNGIPYPIHDSIPHSNTDKQNIGGGLTCTKHTELCSHPIRHNAMAILKDPFETTSISPTYRYHIVKRPDMFTTIDGTLPYSIGRREN